MFRKNGTNIKIALHGPFFLSICNFCLYTVKSISTFRFTKLFFPLCIPIEISNEVTILWFIQRSLNYLKVMQFVLTTFNSWIVYPNNDIFKSTINKYNFQHNIQTLKSQSTNTIEKQSLETIKKISFLINAIGYDAKTSLVALCWRDDQRSSRGALHMRSCVALVWIITTPSIETIRMNYQTFGNGLSLSYFIPTTVMNPLES